MWAKRRTLGSKGRGHEYIDLGPQNAVHGDQWSLKDTHGWTPIHVFQDLHLYPNPLCKFPSLNDTVKERNLTQYNRIMKQYLTDRSGLVEL